MTTPKVKLAGRALEAQLAEQEGQFREMLEFGPAALAIVDEDGHLLFHNARLRELLGYQEETEAGPRQKLGRRSSSSVGLIASRAGCYLSCQRYHKGGCTRRASSNPAGLNASWNNQYGEIRK